MAIAGYEPLVVVAVKSFLVRLVETVVPATCAGCALPGEAICRSCRSSLRPIVGELCGGCGHPHAVRTDRCAECRGRLVGARSAVRYAGPAPNLVSSFKDGARPALAGLLAGVVCEHTPPPAAATLVPIPLTAGREARRGFNQSALLARALSERWGIPWRDVLRRAGSESSQRGSGARARVDQVRGVFVVREGVELPERVCLVDDVHTTGATLAAAAQSLRLGGVPKITARCFARALRRS